MLHLCLARAAVCALATLAPSAIAASPSSAAVASSTITTPSDPSYLQEDGQTPAPITVSGTVIQDGGAGAVDLRCYVGESSELFASEVPVSYSGDEGTFSTSFVPNGISLEQTCVLRAVPAGEEPSSLNSFAGPRVALSYFEDSEVSEGPNAGDIQDFFISDSQLDGVGDYRSLTGGGMYDASPLDSSFVSGGDLFYANDTYNALSGAGVSGSSIQVDGIDAYGPASASGLFTGSDSMAGFQPLTVSHSYDPSNGDLTVHETEPLLECAPEPAVYPPTESSCTSFVGAGVAVTRTIRQDQQGRQSTLTDAYSSTDGRDHRLHLESIEDASNSDAGYDFPWVDGETYKPRTAGETVSPPVQGPVTVFVNYKNSEADGDPEGAQGAITFSGVPDNFAFAPSGLAGETHFTATFTRTISPTAPVTLTQVFSWSSTSSQARTLAAAAQSAQSPTVTITSPTGEATLTTSPAHITGTVTPGGNGLPETVTVQGGQVKLTADRSFSAEVPLLTGANTITVTATDTEKLSSSATVSVTYTPVEPISGRDSSSGSSPAGAAGGSPGAQTNQGLLPIAHDAVAEILRLTRTGRSVSIALACRTGLGCKGRASITFRRRRIIHGKAGRHTETVTLAAAGFSIPAGATRTVTLALSFAARVFILHHSPVAGTLTIILAQPGKVHTYLTRALTLGASRARRGSG